MTIYGYGQPQYLMEYYNNWLERNRDIAPQVTIEMVQTASEADARQKVITTFASGAFNELPTAVQTAPVSMLAMAEAGILVDLTDFLAPLEDQLVPGALDEMKYKGRIYALPESIRPNSSFTTRRSLTNTALIPTKWTPSRAGSRSAASSKRRAAAQSTSPTSIPGPTPGGITAAVALCPRPTPGSGTMGQRRHRHRSRRQARL